MSRATVHLVSLTLLLPASAVITALTVLTLSLRSVERELIALRSSLRRSTATAVATDELSRTTTRVRAQMHEQATDAQRRLAGRPRWWNQHPPRDR